MKVLHDKRLLVVQDYMTEKQKKVSKICVYDLSNSIVCNINYDSNLIIKIFPMSDSNAILSKFLQIEIIKITHDHIEQIFNMETGFVNDVYQISENRFVIYGGYLETVLYYYSNDKLSKCKDMVIDANDEINIHDICKISRRNIAIYFHKSGKIYGQNAYVKFYDINENQKIYTLRLGGYSSGTKMLSLDENNLIVEYNHKLLLIDPELQIIKNELYYNSDKTINRLMLLNNNIILATIPCTITSCIYHYEIKKDKIILIKEHPFKKFNTFEKFPGNNIIMSHKNKIFIAGN